MLKHLDDGGALNMVIDTAGNLLVICSKCKRIWQGDLTLAESPTAAKNLSKRPMLDTLREKPDFLKDVGIDMKYLAGLKFQ